MLGKNLQVLSIEKALKHLREALRHVDADGDRYEVGPYLDLIIQRLEGSPDEGHDERGKPNIVDLKRHPRS